MPEKELNCNPEVCDLKFMQINDVVKELKLDNEQRREEVQAIKEAMVKISTCYEQTSTDITDIRGMLGSKDANKELWGIFKMVIVALIAIAGMAVGIQIPQ